MQVYGNAIKYHNLLFENFKEDKKKSQFTDFIINFCFSQFC